MRPALIALTAVALSAPSVVTAQRDWHDEVVLDRAVALAAGGTLTIDVPDADVEIEPGAGPPGVTLMLGAHDLDWARPIYEDMRFAIRETSDGLSITSRDVRVPWREQRGHGGMRVTVLVRTPVALNVRVETGDGDVLVGDLQGRLEVVTADGDVSLGAVTGSRIVIRTSDGDIEAAALRGSDVTVRTNDGDIYIHAVEGALTASSGDGDMVIGLMTVTGVSLDTGDGDILIDAPVSLAAELDLRGEDIHITRNITVVGSVANNFIRGTMNGGGPRVLARTGDGTIVVRGR